jgi:hypothetical protein
MNKTYDYILVSYASGMPGFSPSEWLQDKLMVLSMRNANILLITSLGSQLKSSKNLHVVKIPSLSFKDFLIEKQQSGNLTQRIFHYEVVSKTAGRLFDLCFRFLAGTESAGRWSWCLSSLPVLAWYIAKNKRAQILATGGPSSAHLSTAIAGRLLSRKVIFEFQDPFIGVSMVLPTRLMKVLQKIENFIIRNSEKTVYVTNVASNRARIRHPLQKERVVTIYPGAWNYFKELPPASTTKSPDPAIEFLHLGTLYGNRNLNALFEAVDEFNLQNKAFLTRLKIVNLGSMYGDFVGNYQLRPDFHQLKELPRIDALKRAHLANFLLLVQHSDLRSEETIPFKFYDYLNLGSPIFALHNNSELANLVRNSGGFAAHLDSKSEIISALAEAIASFENSRNNVLGVTQLEINAADSFDKLFEPNVPSS